MDDAAELIANTEKRFRDAVRLARVVSIASRIEPELLRQARLQLLPTVDAGAEADLWFSPLVQAATPVALTLVPAVADLLRRELAQSPKALRSAWELLEQVHRDAPAAIRLEERVTWETLSGRAGSLKRVEDELMSVVSAINVQKRSGLARWALRAVPRLPEEARKTTAATTLVLTAATHLKAWHLLEKQIESNTLSGDFINQLQIVLPPDLPKVKVGVRLLQDMDQRKGYLIEYSAPPSADAKNVIEVPGTAPLMLEVSWGETPEQIVRNLNLYQGRTETVALGVSSSVSIRTAAGDVYTLSRDEQTDVPPTPDAPKTVVTRIPGPPSIGYVRRHMGSGQDLVEKLLADLSPAENRIVQLAGSGGAGKTTIAAEAARAFLDPYKQRVVWLSAAGRSDFSVNSILDGVATQLSRSDLRTLELTEKTDEVKLLLQDGPAIICVDDFETIGAKEERRCLRFLKTCGCSVLIVSRRVLTSIYTVFVNEMSQDEANEFLRRTIEQQPEIRGVPEFRPLERIISVCEGNPLAMQLLFAQMDFVDGETNALNEMSSGKDDVLIRVFDLSFDLPQLGDDGRRALLATVLFVPSASKEALAEVAGLGGDLKRLNEATRKLTRLKLASDISGNRLAVDGFNRDAVERRLIQSGIANELRGRFVEYFLKFAEQRSESDVANYDALELEFENLLDAMDMAEILKRWEELTRLCIALTDFLDVRGYWDEALRRNGEAQKAARKAKRNDDIPVLDQAAGYIYLKRRQFAKAQEAFRRVLSYYFDQPPNTEVAIATRRLGSVELEQGNLALAENYYQEALDISRKLGFQIGIADNIHNLAIVAQDKGQLARARKLYLESLHLSVRLNDDRSQAITLHQLGVIAMETRKYFDAEQYLSQSLKIKRKLQDRSAMADTLHQLGLLYQKETKPSEAEKALREALNIYNQLRSPSAREVEEDLNSLQPAKKLSRSSSKAFR